MIRNMRQKGLFCPMFANQVLEYQDVIHHLKSQTLDKMINGVKHKVFNT
jgi:hypothetical protein